MPLLALEQNLLVRLILSKSIHVGYGPDLARGKNQECIAIQLSKILIGNLQNCQKHTKGRQHFIIASNTH